VIQSMIHRFQNKQYDLLYQYERHSLDLQRKLDDFGKVACRF